MKKFTLGLICMLIGIMSFSSLAYADLNAAIVPGTQNLSVSGTIEGASEERLIIQVLNPGMDEDDIKTVTPDTFDTVFNNYAMVTANVDGFFKLPEYKMTGDSGFYTVRIVRADKGGEALLYPDAARFVSPGFESDLLAMVKDAATDELKKSLRLYIDSHYEIMDIAPANYIDYSEDDRDKAVGYIAGKSYADIAAFKTALDCAVFNTVVNSCKESADIASAYPKFADSLSEACPLISELYNASLSAELWQALFDGRPYDSIDTLIQKIGDTTILKAVKFAEYHSLLEAILSSSASWLNEDFSAYFSLSDKKPVNTEIVGQSFGTTVDLVSAVKEEVGRQSRTPPVSSPPGKKPGGGSTSVQLPPVSEAPPVTPDDEPEDKFGDIADVPWAETAINALAEKCIVNGASDGVFMPERSISREEFLKILVLAFPGNGERAALSFSDCSESDWFYPYVSEAVARNIAKGISDELFGTAMNITRQDMAVLLYRAANEQGIIFEENKNVNFADEAAIADYAKEAVLSMAKSGIINGVGDNSFAPLENATRAEAAKMIYELMLKGSGVK